MGRLKWLAKMVKSQSVIVNSLSNVPFLHVISHTTQYLNLGIPCITL
jgi:hypothetical protein